MIYTVTNREGSCDAPDVFLSLDLEGVCESAEVNASTYAANLAAD
jgi:hypothetical protein